MPALTIIDEKPGRSREQVMTLECLNEEMTVREIIRTRIIQEVNDYNQRLEVDVQKNAPKLLVTPSEIESKLNEKASNSATAKAMKRKPINWEKQFKLACESFDRNGFFVLVGDYQPEELDEVIKVKVDTEVTFIKLVQLVGG